jgi:hypothetical protein
MNVNELKVERNREAHPLEGLEQSFLVTQETVPFPIMESLEAGKLIK